MKKKKIPNFITRSWTSKKTGIKSQCYYHRSSAATGRQLTSLGTDYREAIKKWADIEGLEIEKPESDTLAAIYDAYMEWANRRDISSISPRTIKDRQGYWKNHLNPVFGKCKVDDIKPQWLLTYYEKRSSQVSAKKEIKFLSVMFNWAKLRSRMHSENPTNDIMRQLKVDELREIYVHDEWLALVYKYSSPLVRDAMNACYLFCNRPAETEAMKITDIEHDEIVISLEKTRKKGLKEKRIPINGKRKEYVDQQKKRSVRSIYLVTDENSQPLKTSGKKFKREFKEARDKAQAEAEKLGIHFERFQLRDLRAKSATDIATEHGIEAARLMCGHTTQKQTIDYIRSIKGAAKKALKIANWESDF